MPALRFSMLSLLAAMGLVAIAFAALANPSVYWVAGLGILNRLALCAALVVAIVHRGKLQAFAIGFGVSGIAFRYLDGEVLYGPSVHLLYTVALAAGMNFSSPLMERLARNTTEEWLFASGIHVFSLAVSLGCGFLGRYCYSLREREKSRTELPGD